MTQLSSRSALVTLPSDTQIMTTREFAAPKHLVYKAYTTPELIERWWTAKRGSMTVCEVDLRVGGAWRWVMVTAEDFEVAFHGTYQEIVPDERLVSTEVYEGVPGGDDHPVVNTLTLVEQNGRTKLTLVTEAHTQEIRDMIISSGMEDGMQDAYDLLEEAAVLLL